MPGGRPSGFLLGGSAERLAEFIIGSFAFTTPVPYQVDIGHDFHCFLQVPGQNRRMKFAGPSFTVQVKSVPGPIRYLKQHAYEWLANLENPLFICIVNRRKLQCDFYSTWNMQNGLLMYGTMRTVLIPGESIGQLTEPAEGVLRVPLGPPILSLTPGLVANEEHADRWATLFKPWIDLDRQNIANRAVGIYWVVGPGYWKANEPISEDAPALLGFYRHPKNLARCLNLFTTSAVALRRVLDLYPDASHILEDSEERSLDTVIEEFFPFMDIVTMREWRNRQDELTRRRGEEGDSEA